MTSLSTSRMENIGDEESNPTPFKGAPALLDYSVKQFEHNMKFAEEEVVHPLRMDAHRGPYTFKCSSANGYLHLAATRLWGRFTIQNADGTPLAPAAQEALHNLTVGPVNMLPHAIWKSINVTVNGTEVSSFVQARYGYKAYLQTLLGYGIDAKSTTLNVGGHFEMDTADHFESTVVLIPPVAYINAIVAPAANPRDGVHAVAGNRDAVNLGWNKRRVRHGNSNSVDFMIPLVHDFFQVKELLIPGVSFEVTFNRNPDDFFLQYAAIAPNTYKLSIDKLQLHLRRVTLKDDIVARHKIIFAKHDIPYHHIASLTKTFNLQQGVAAHYIPHVFGSKVPNQIVVGILSQNAYQGQRNLNPFNFQNAAVIEIHLQYAGRSLPGYVFTPDFANGRFAREYINLMDNSGINQKDCGCAITRELFNNGCCLYAWDTSPDLCYSLSHRHPRWHGGIDLSIKFVGNLAAPMVAFVMAWYDSMFCISSDHQLFFPDDLETLDATH